MFFFFLSRQFTGTEDTGEFNCPSCRQKEEYDLRSARSWLTLYYFIPLFPVSGIQKYVECRGCRNIFSEEILVMPPQDGNRFNGYYTN